MPWFLAAVLLLVALVAFFAWHRLRARPAEPPARRRGRVRALPTGQPAPYDLAKDDSTKHQRYLM